MNSQSSDQQAADPEYAIPEYAEIQDSHLSEEAAYETEKNVYYND